MFMTIDPSLEKKIIEQINISGIPCEIEILDICGKKNTGRYPNQRYRCDDKLKEIDLHAFFEEICFNSKRTPQFTRSNLVIECKQSRKHPWVFFSSPMYRDSDSLLFLKNESTYDTYFNRMNKYSLFGQICVRMKKNHYLDASLPKCTSFFEVFSTSNKSSIYEALESVLSYTQSEMNSWDEKKLDEFDALTNFYYPIIVFDGILIEASISGDNITITERQHLQIRHLREDEFYIIDVVKRDYFKDFLDKIEKNHIEVVDLISKIRLNKEFKKEILKKNKIRIDEYIKSKPLVALFR